MPRCSILRDANKSRSSAGIIIFLFFPFSPIRTPERVIPEDFFLMAPSWTKPSKPSESQGLSLFPRPREGGGRKREGTIKLCNLCDGIVALIDA